MVREHADRRAAPRLLLTEARHGESGRVLETWSERWAAEILQECATPVTGLEAAQVRKEEAVQRPCRLRGVAPSLVQQAPAAGATSERLACAPGARPYGQRCHTRVREAWAALLWWVASLLARGRKCADIVALLLPVSRPPLLDLHRC
jgi:hypothetical protein